MMNTDAGIRVISSAADLSVDLARKHRFTPSSGHEDIPKAVVDEDYAVLMRDGYVVLESLLDAQAIAGLKEAASLHLGHTGRNTFEGERTQRVYDVLSKTRAFDALAEHPRVLALLNRLLLPNYLLSQAQIINILPDSPAQMLHHDDGAYPVPKPRPPLGAATVWAIDAFTQDNGATAVVPGSHLWDADRLPKPAEAWPCVMPAGSAVLFLGTLWHGGGENRSAAPRLAATCQYCEPWLRQQENFLLEVSREVASGLSENLLRMIGYSVHPPFYGMVNGMHPRRLLEDLRR